ncbi:MAG TPA: DUF971 domain-containing protein [Caldithrix abyssi]|uniref:DUF971 domain-containing protein n=1 Tax=Caldithrix abyssi TaxID=187145 RepID=A0A7V4U1V9_CALAY|nr:DUF971 domain-containing protein [Caldithrix abyssi]
MDQIELTDIRRISDTVIVILWSDGHESLYFADHLRKNCPCAACEKRPSDTSEGLFKIYGQNMSDVKLTGWVQMGRYAVEFHFSDGHNTGIYPYNLLRELCQCDVCTGNAIRIEGPLNSK